MLERRQVLVHSLSLVSTVSQSKAQTRETPLKRIEFETNSKKYEVLSILHSPETSRTTKVLTSSTPSTI
jgi:hypothetical protein